MLTVQYPETQIKTLNDFKQIPLRSADGEHYAASIRRIDPVNQHPHGSGSLSAAPRLRRLCDAPHGGSQQGAQAGRFHAGKCSCSRGITIKVRGTVRDMEQSFSSFGMGLLLAIVLVFLILMAQFASFSDPFIILLAIPPALAGALLFLLVTGSTLNVMSLMGIVMTTGIAVSNSILIVEFTGTLLRSGMEIKAALIESCKARLRPILMTSLATILGLIPMAMALEPGSEQYAPLTRAILGGLAVSVVITIFLVPSAYLLIHRNRKHSSNTAEVAH